MRRTGSLQATLSPPEAITAGARWKRVGTPNWLASGITETNIPTGNYTVEFLDLPTSWSTPVTKGVTINENKTTTVSVSYTRHTGSVCVVINPSVAVTAGAQWRRVGTTWRNSGTTETVVPTGNYQIEFKPITGWSSPVNILVKVSQNKSSSASSVYVRHVGSLKVLLSPVAAVTVGAEWRRVGTFTWKNSGVIETNIPTGNYSVEFKSITGWVVPANQPVTIAYAQTTQASGVYAPHPGALRVTLSPVGAVTAGAKWRRVGTATWHDSATTDTAVPIGSCAVEFRDATGWRKPANKSATIAANKITQLNASYGGFLAIGLVSPTTVGALPGQSVTFQVVTLGSLPITYQWKRNGTNIYGATDASCIMGPCQWVDEGFYSCVAHNAYGTAESGKIRLVVNSGVKVLEYLLGQSTNPDGLDLNGDTKINVADLLRGIQDTPPADPASPSPGSGATGIGIKPRLNWADCHRAQSYSVYLWKMATARPDAPNVTGLTARQWDVTPSLEAATDYWWQVVAVGAASSTEGPIWVFKTK